MTKTIRNKIIRLSVLAISVLFALVLAVQFVYVPPKSSSSSSASSDAANGGSGLRYTEVENVVADDYALSDNTIKTRTVGMKEPAKDKSVDVIVSLDGTPMMDYASANGMTVAKALSTAKGHSNLVKLNGIRDSALAELSRYIIEYKYNITTVLNAFAATVRYGDIAAIEKSSYVKDVIISQTYLAPEAVTENYVDVYETGIFNSEGVGYDGTGTVVAVLDTGTDYTHPVFDMELDGNTLALTKDDVAAVTPVLTATSMSAAKDETIDEDDMYLRSKLPFAYDYADSDTNVYPHEQHGTHVASIITGKSDEITGVAPGSQLATFKVFSDYTTGAKTEAILAALNDAVTLGVDVINMSLGTSCGFTREVDEVAINEVYDRINENGICLVVAASNDGSSSQGSTWGNTNLASNPDSGTVGSPGSYTASLSVASVSGVKTRYFITGGKEVYFSESRLVGKTDPNDFVAGMLGDEEEGEFEYVVIPGVGLDINYVGMDVSGKIAVVRRGSNSFEEKVKIAASNGAIGVIVYNNVSGTISMSVGTKYRIPSCFVTMDYSEEMVALGTGTVHLSKSYLAGPFMSDFSSWGCLPNLVLAPDITAHGGEIYAAVPGAKYDKLSGTSMAAPNLAGALILVCQYVKENNAGATSDYVRDEAYGRMMSTATIVKNEEGNPYSPRKQGAGIADISHSVNTKAYLTVDGSNKPKLSLGDDKDRTGVYELNFNIVNTSNSAVGYNLGQYVMTESISSDDRTVSEKAHMFDDVSASYAVKATKGVALLRGKTVSLSGYAEAAVTVTLTLSQADKDYLDYNFRNGMFVEGYVVLDSNGADGIDLSIPYMAFYGDWTDAPMLDVTEYEVGASAVDDSVLAEDKLKPDVYATIPFAGFYSYTSDDNLAYYGLGDFPYIPAIGYEAPPTQEKFAALTNNPDGNYMLYAINAGLLRGAKRVEMEIRNSATGELIWQDTDYNARKSHASGGTQIGGYVLIELDMRTLDLPNNAKYTFNMTCYLDWTGSMTDSSDKSFDKNNYVYGNKNTYSFEFTMDNEAPALSDTAVRKVKSGNSYNYYLDLTMYDNHYLAGYTVYTYSKKTTTDTGRVEYEDFVSLTPNGVVPMDGNFNSDTVDSIDISGYWDTICKNNGNLYVAIYDYAKNNVALEVQIDEASVRKSDIIISKTASAASGYTIAPTGQLDLRQYLSIKASVDDSIEDPADRTYLENYWMYDLVWSSSDENVVTVYSDGDRQGEITGVAEGTATISARTPNVTEEELASWRASLESAATDEEKAAWKKKIDDHYLEFTINVSPGARVVRLTGIEMSMTSVTLERGEEVTLSASVYNYEGTPQLTWSSNSPNVPITVNEDGTVTVFASKSGRATISATLVGTYISGQCSVRVLSEFEYSNNYYLRGYTGRGGDYVNENGETEHNVVEIPDDASVIYIASGAFSKNNHIKKVIIPEGVTTIMRTAFYNCPELETVVLPSTLETIEVAAFAECVKLKNINFDNVKSIGNSAFWGCDSLESLSFKSCTYIDGYAFAFCTGLTELDLTGVGIVGGGAFTFCTGLKSLVIPAETFLEYNTEYLDLRDQQIGGAFNHCLGLESVVVYSNNIGKYSFFNCQSLNSVVFMNAINEIDEYAFAGCFDLATVSFQSTAYKIDDFAFANCLEIRSITLPAGLTILGNNVFYKSSKIQMEEGEDPVPIVDKLTRIRISSGALLDSVSALALTGSENVEAFEVEDGNKYLSSQDGVLYDRQKVKLIAYPAGKTATSLTLPATTKTIGKSAFSGVGSLQSINIGNVEYIDDYAFYSAMGPGSVPHLTITGNYRVKYIGDYAFFGAMLNPGNSTTPSSIPIYSCTKHIGDYAFAGCRTSSSGAMSLTLPALDYLGDYAFAGMEFVFVDGNTRTVSLNIASVSFEDSGIKTVGAGVFSSSHYLQEIASFGSLTEISDYMFADCPMLVSVAIPDTVKTIGAHAFEQCKALESVTLSNGLERIGDSAFESTALINVNIPDKVKDIGSNAFKQSTLQTVNLNNVERIGDGAFAETALTSVSSDKVLYIGNGAFSKTPLASASFDSATDIGASAFEDCASLASIGLSSVKNIGASAFKGCVGITSIALDNAETIGDKAFEGAAGITQVSLPKLVSIGNEAFAGTGITEISLSATVTSIADKAFRGAADLVNIVVDADNEKYLNPVSGEGNAESDPHYGVLYSVNEDNYYILVSYPAARASAGYTVHERTIKLGAYSFCENKNIQSLDFSPYLQTIGVSAMTGMTSLKSIVMYSVDAPTLESYATLVKVGSTGGTGDDDDINDDVIEDNTEREFVNKYDNFSFAMGDETGAAGLTISVPYNSTGYNNRIWQQYVGKCLQKTDSIHVGVGTLEFIDRIKRVLVQGSSADPAQINNLRVIYNRLSSLQQRFITGRYEYDDGNGHSIDEEYYTALLGGRDYMAELNALAGNRAAQAVSSAFVKADGISQASEQQPMWYVAAIVAFVAAFAAGLFIAKARRSRR